MTQFRLIRDVLARDLSKPIEEVIKLSQTDEEVVYTELTEYVVTDNLRRAYRDLLKAINESATNPTEGVGVWVSGFFGSGKSAFVKNVGYILANPTVKGQPASELFIQQVQASGQTDMLPDLIRNLVARVPFEVIMFDVSADRAVQRENERLAEIMYRVLLRHLDYESRRYEIAELEIELEKEGRLGEFVRILARRYGNSQTPAGHVTVPQTLVGEVTPEEYAVWRQIRSGAQAINRASAVLHELDPTAYPDTTTWAKTTAIHGIDVTVRLLIERTFDLVARRRPGRAVAFIIDEVGQYVARSADKILDLQAVAREFGAYGRNQAVSGKAPAPAWLLVTSQEKLNEVVDAIGDKRVELAKLQDSFRHHIDLGPQDIREVASRRVLRKKPEARPFLEKLFLDHRGVLQDVCKLEQTTRFAPIRPEEFVDAYPYLPHLIDLSIDIMSALRLQSGAVRHLGGSNRTIIKQAYEMLVNERTNLAQAPVGTLVTLDKVYELVAINLSSEKQRDIGEIDARFERTSWEARVARVLALIEPVSYLPRTARNIAALLYERMGQSPGLAEVEQALQQLEEAQFVRQTEEGWKLLTRDEKIWETERREYRPNLAEERALLIEALDNLWNEPALRNIPYPGRNFSPMVDFEDRTIYRGSDFPLHLIMVEPEEMEKRIQQVRRDSRATEHRNDVYWVFPRTSALDNALLEWARSKYMVSRYSRVAAENRLSPEQVANLESEKRLLERYEREVQRLLQDALLQGVGVFRGMSRRSGEFGGRNWTELLREVVRWVVPDLYNKLEMGQVQITEKDIREVLRATQWSQMPPVFFAGEDGLGLIEVRQGNYAVNPEAPVALEILTYIRQEQDYGNSVTGKKLEQHFAAPPYGWSTELLRAVLAILLRDGQIEIVVQGRKHQHLDDPVVRRVFEGVRDFRTATFRLRRQIDVRIRLQAAETLAQLKGQRIQPEEPAIMAAAREWVQQMRGQVSLADTRARDHGLTALLPPLKEMQHLLSRLEHAEVEEVIRILSEERHDVEKVVEAYRRVAALLTDDNALKQLRYARQVLQQRWPDIRDLGQAPQELAQEVEKALAAFEDLELPNRLEQIWTTAQQVEAIYKECYADLHLRRGDAYGRALEQVMEWAEWERIEVDDREEAIQPLVRRACQTLDYNPETGRCNKCQANLLAMDADLRAVEGYLAQVREDLLALVPVEDDGGQPIPRRVVVHLRELLPTATVRTAEDVQALVDRLNRVLLAHVQEGEEVELAW